MGEGVKTLDLQITKESITVSGTTNYDGTNIKNITISFNPDIDVENNTAMFKSVRSDENGEYITEVMPGSYNVTIDETVNESGVFVTYKYSGLLDLIEAGTSKTYDIVMIREE